MKRLVLAGVIFACCMLTAVAQQEIPDPEVFQAAAKGLPYFVGKIPDGQARNYGFDDKAAAESFSLGSPYRLYVISPKALAAYKTNEPIESTMTSGSIWYFPVKYNDNVCAILVVDWMKDHWEAVSLGYSGLARELDRMERAWPARDGYCPRLVVLLQASQYFFHIPLNGLDNLTALSPVPSSVKLSAAETGKRYRKLTRMGDISDDLKIRVENNINSFRRMAP